MCNNDPAATYLFPLAGPRLGSEIAGLLQQVAGEIVRLDFVHNSQPCFWWRYDPTNTSMFVVIKPVPNREAERYFRMEAVYSGVVICGYHATRDRLTPSHNKHVVEETAGFHDRLEAAFQTALRDRSFPQYEERAGSTR